MKFLTIAIFATLLPLSALAMLNVEGAQATQLYNALKATSIPENCDYDFCGVHAYEIRCEVGARGAATCELTPFGTDLILKPNAAKSKNLAAALVGAGITNRAGVVEALNVRCATGRAINMCEIFP